MHHPAAVALGTRVHAQLCCAGAAPPLSTAMVPVSAQQGLECARSWSDDGVSIVATAVGVAAAAVDMDALSLAAQTSNGHPL